MCVQEAERTWQLLEMHAHPCLFLYTETHRKLTSAIYLHVELIKVRKEANELAAAHTEDSILQTGQPFKQLSVTVTNSNPKTSPLSLPPQETDPLPG